MYLLLVELFLHFVKNISFANIYCIRYTLYIICIDNRFKFTLFFIWLLFVNVIDFDDIPLDRYLMLILLYLQWKLCEVELHGIDQIFSFKQNSRLFNSVLNCMCTYLLSNIIHITHVFVLHNKNSGSSHAQSLTPTRSFRLWHWCMLFYFLFFCYIQCVMFPDNKRYLFARYIQNCFVRLGYWGSMCI